MIFEYFSMRKTKSFLNISQWFWMISIMLNLVEFLCFLEFFEFILTKGWLLCLIELTPVDFSLASATRNDVTYEFYTASSGKCDISKLNKHHRTIIITHGYRGTITENWIQEAKEAFLKLNIYNIILVNWTPAAGPLLSAAGNNVKRVGKYLAQTILGAKLRPELIQIVGKYKFLISNVYLWPLWKSGKNTRCFLRNFSILTQYVFNNYYAIF